jgi:hypothetical protein
MTLGFALATWTDTDDRVALIAADTRITSGGDTLTDAGVKTYELGGAAAVVASGHALPPMMAAELARSLIDNHNRRTPDRRVGFFDTVRLFAFFLKRLCSEQNASCSTAVAGFLNGSTPCLASVVAGPNFNRAGFMKVKPGGMSALPVGDPVAAKLLLRAVAEAKSAKLPRVSYALSMLYYIAQLRGVFETVGGGISVGTCLSTHSCFSWPIVGIGGCRFLRGMDVTAHHRPGWPEPELIAYDEEWCHALDQRVATEATTGLSAVAPRWSLPGIDIDEIDPATLFATHDDSELTHDDLLL